MIHPHLIIPESFYCPSVYATGVHAHTCQKLGHIISFVSMRKFVQTFDRYCMCHCA